MVFYLYGPDSYRRGEKLRELLDAYRSKHENHDLLHVDLDEEAEEGWRKAKDFLGQPSMFVESKLLILRSVGKEKHAEFAGVIQGELDTEHTFIIISDEVAPTEDFSFLLKKPSRSQKFMELSHRELGEFLKQKAAEKEIRFSPGGWNRFTGIFQGIPENEGKTWRAIMELEKLALLSGGGEISEESVERAIHYSPVRDFYGLARNVLFGRSLALRLSALEELSAGNFDSGWVFNTLCFLAKGPETVRLAEADVAVKSGRLDYEAALTKIAIGI